MIVRARPESFCCLTQHHHARVAGALAEHWPLSQFPGLARRDEVLLAICEHDRGWIALDATPRWNTQQQAPYSFLDYPTLPKLQHYQQGIDEVAALSPYAGLLCSLHYSSFQHLASSAAGLAFLQHEARRQQELRQQLTPTDPVQEAALSFHFQLLQFCDSLSLYLCAGAPDFTQASDQPAFQALLPTAAVSCFPGSFQERAYWLNHRSVQLQGFPGTQPFLVTMRYVELSKAAIRAHGLAACYAQAPVQEQTVELLPAR